MKRLHSAGLKCKIDKCRFAVPKVEYLLFIITSEGVKLKSKSIKAVLNLERPKDKKTREAVPRYGTILPLLMAELQ